MGFGGAFGSNLAVSANKVSMNRLNELAGKA